jgi:hypothetical protein
VDEEQLTQTEMDRSCQFKGSNEPRSFVADICANHLPLVYGWSSVDLRLIYISLFVAVVNAFSIGTSSVGLRLVFG